MTLAYHERIVAGVELECYTIDLPDFRIGRQLAFPRKGVGERGERFGRDWSIGTEYSSRPFSTIREGLFLLKAGLRKYSRQHYRSTSRTRKGKQLLLVGGWRDRFAGAHIHLSVAERTLAKEDARRLASHLHDHMPLFIAVGANSPVWGDEISPSASSRIVKASDTYFRAVRRHEITCRSMDEMLYSRGRKTKPPTLEIRTLDSNLPEFVMAAVALVKAACLNWLHGRGAANRIPHADYLKSRRDAAERGLRARLCWNGRWMKATEYLDRFVWTLREPFARMDIPQEVWTTFKLLKKGINGSDLLRQATRIAYEEHPQTWQRRFAKRYARALDALLSGNTILDFAARLGVPLPDLDDTWLGRRRLKLL
jgi:gamma-glutamyl:cysteine ligase YbdK (ATP-grasp superfamily)